MPDALIFSTVLLRLTGTKIIFDLQDPMPEVGMARFALAASHPMVKGLRWLEKWSVRFSHLVITPNLAFKELFTSRSCPESKIHIVMNTPDPKMFGPGPSADHPTCTASAEQCRLMYHGTIVDRNGLDTALEAVYLLRDQIPGLILHVYGSGDFVERWSRFDPGTRPLEPWVVYHGAGDASDYCPGD